MSRVLGCFCSYFSPSSTGLLIHCFSRCFHVSFYTAVWLFFFWRSMLWGKAGQSNFVFSFRRALALTLEFGKQQHWVFALLRTSKNLAIFQAFVKPFCWVISHLVSLVSHWLVTKTRWQKWKGVLLWNALFCCYLFQFLKTRIYLDNTLVLLSGLKVRFLILRCV